MQTTYMYGFITRLSLDICKPFLRVRCLRASKSGSTTAELNLNTKLELLEENKNVVNIDKTYHLFCPYQALIKFNKKFSLHFLRYRAK